jgi:hypothetical protein
MRRNVCDVMRLAPSLLAGLIVDSHLQWRQTLRVVKSFPRQQLSHRSKNCAPPSEIVYGSAG